MESFTAPADVAHAIQLSVAPVFLLTAIAGMLNLLSGRLARAVDLTRAAYDRVGRQPAIAALPPVLARRILIIHWAIRLHVCAGLCICLVVVTIFLGDHVAPDLSIAMAVFFIGSMALMTAGLGLLLVEIGLATRITQFEIDALEAEVKRRRAAGAGMAEG